ncbi:hypothetical protein ABVF11_06640 [Pediococcus argentinicus]|uniref:hypothetical protein n=1 Tax=Pediococcus argentinicus TaxID=480391 RepID=UPI00338F0B60
MRKIFVSPDKIVNYCGIAGTALLLISPIFILWEYFVVAISVSGILLLGKYLQFLPCFNQGVGKRLLGVLLFLVLVVIYLIYILLFFMLFKH